MLCVFMYFNGINVCFYLVYIVHILTVMYNLFFVIYSLNVYNSMCCVFLFLYFLFYALYKQVFSTLVKVYRGTETLLRTPQRFLAANGESHFFAEWFF